MNPQLDSLLSGNAHDAQATVNAKTKLLLQDRPDGFVFFGAGRLGRIALANARAAGLDVHAFADNDLSRADTELDGLPILSPAAAFERFGASAQFVITIYTSEPVWRQIREAGIEPSSFGRLAWLHPDHFLPHAGLDLPGEVYAETSLIEKAYSVLADPASKSEFRQQLEWRTTLQPEVLGSHPPASETYFADDLFDLRPDENFVDCGAFDGDSVRAFLARTGGKFQSVTALEPDASNRANFEVFRQGLGSADAAKIDLLPYAVSDAPGKVRFDATGTAASVLGSGDGEIECVTLDAALKRPATFIKMDIEGAEPLAIRGARQQLAKAQPIVAACIYHAQRHLWEIPLLLHELMPDAKISIRRYAAECWELVCFAIPTKRWKLPPAN